MFNNKDSNKRTRWGWEDSSVARVFASQASRSDFDFRTHFLKQSWAGRQLSRNLPGIMSLISRTYIKLEGENQFRRVVLWSPHVCHRIHALHISCFQTQRIIINLKSAKKYRGMIMWACGLSMEERQVALWGFLDSQPYPSTEFQATEGTSKIKV